ncbi:MAG: hypothetical protein CBC29_05685 [Methylococcaceae bacterium TMED69]|nr:MAG: hypothetical protein CBC29_05685 [Methylococcaceae bacterium TMED69]
MSYTGFSVSPAQFQSDSDEQTATSHLNQLIDVVQEDISQSVSRRQYQVFVTGGIGPGVTSSLYQSVYDQDFSLQTANPIMDMTVGLFYNSRYGSGAEATPLDNIVSRAPGFSRDANTGKLNFAQNTMMMREKVSNYRQMAAHCLGDPNAPFMLHTDRWPYDGSGAGDAGGTGTAGYADDAAGEGQGYEIIHEALFLNLRRLFVRDGIRKETFAMRLYPSASLTGFDGEVVQGTTGSVLAVGTDASHPENTAYSYYLNGERQATVQTFAADGSKPGRQLMAMHLPTGITGSNVSILGHSPASTFPPMIMADLGASTNTKLAACGDVARLVDSSNTNRVLGLIFYHSGLAVLDMKKCFWGEQQMFGHIDAMTDSTFNSADATAAGYQANKNLGTFAKGRTVIGGKSHAARVQTSTNAVSFGGAQNQYTNQQAKFIPDFLVSSSIDNILDHIGTVRLGSSSLTALAWQNQTSISSNIYFCRAPASQYNFSNNPTFINQTTGQYNTITDISSSTQTTFTFITTVGLYSGDNLVAVAKLNRPIEKNNETDLTIRVRLDF